MVPFCIIATEDHRVTAKNKAKHIRIMPLLSYYATYLLSLYLLSTGFQRSGKSGLVLNQQLTALPVVFQWPSLCHPITCLLCDDHSNKLRLHGHSGRKEFFGTSPITRSKFPNILKIKNLGTVQFFQTLK